MADTKISALPLASTPLDGTEVLPIVQSNITEKVSVNDLTVRNIRANATTGILQITGPAAATTRIATVPNANFTVARTDAGQTFTGIQQYSNIVYLFQSAASALLSVKLQAGAEGVGRFQNNTFGANFSLTSNWDTFAGTVDVASYYSQEIALRPSNGDIRFKLSTAVNTAPVDVFILNGTNGNATLSNGNLVIGTSGKGIDFSATSGTGTSELLADYEEGTWTPTNTNAIVVNNAVYTKIGRLVICRFDVTGGASNTVGDMGGLPFTVSAYSSGVVGLNTETVSAVWTIIATSGTVFSFRVGSTQQYISAGKRCAGVLVYETA